MDEPREVRTGAGSVLVIVSCEHAGADIPAEFAALFASEAAREALAGHRGWDPGSLGIAEAFASVLGAPLIVQRVSRLLVECNRSLDHPRLFSEFSRQLGDDERAAAVERYWRGHRERVRAMVRSAPEGSTVVHVGVHTFTPVWEGRRRATDVGLLYDSRRPREATLVRRWKAAMSSEPVVGDLAVHLNRPYRGWTDGLTTTLRGEFPESRSLGIELEVSQGLVVGRQGGEAGAEVVAQGGVLDAAGGIGRAVGAALGSVLVDLEGWVG